MQDQAFMGPESGLAVPDHDGGGVELFVVDPVPARRPQARSRRASASTRTHVRLHLAGVGGAFGAREDVSLQVHCACWRCAPAGR